MALWIEQKYVNLVSNQIPKFRKVDEGLWNGRCPICLDSAKNKSKCRFYIYTVSQALFAQCKNCDYSHKFSTFLQDISPTLYAEYRREMYLESNTGSPQRFKKSDEESTLVIPKIPSRFIKAKPKESDNPFNGSIQCIIDLPDDHEAVQYILDRKIPRNQFHRLFFISHICDLVNVPGFGKYKDRVKGNEPRIILPYFNIDGKMTGVTCRGIRGESFRYIALKLVEDEPMIFGVNDIDFDKPIFVTEGAFDSLFVDNCIAVGGSGIGKLNSLGIDKDKLIIVFDNQPRQREIVGIIEKTIRNGYTVVIWGSRIVSKDINEMMLNNEDYLDQLQNRRYNGLQAKIEFNNWRKV